MAKTIGADNPAKPATQGGGTVAASAKPLDATDKARSALKNTTAIAEAPGLLGDPVAIDPALIRPSPELAVRPINKESGHIEDLAADMAERGQQNPVMVREIKGDPDHGYETVYGNHRIAAAKLNGTSVFAYVLNADDKTAQGYTITENLMRENNSAAASCLVLLKSKKLYDQDPIVTESGQTRGFASAMARQTGKSKPWIQTMLNTAETLVKKTGGEQFFMDIAYTKLDKFSVLQEMANDPAWSGDAVETEVSRYNGLPARDKADFKFRTKKEPRKGDKKIATSLSAEDQKLGGDAQNLLRLVMSWNQADEKVWRQFFTMLKVEFEESKLAPINEDDARTAL